MSSVFLSMQSLIHKVAVRVHESVDVRQRSDYSKRSVKHEFSVSLSANMVKMMA